MKSKGFRASLVIVAALAVIAVVAIIVGVLTHKETTLLLACWEENVAHYVEEGTQPSCDQPEEIIWPTKQIPITITTLGTDNADAAHSAFAKSMAVEVRSLNTELSIPLFAVTPDVGYVSAQEVPYEKSMGNARGAVSHRRDPAGRLSVDLRIVAGLDMPTFHEVCRHELLHVAGLGHDDYEESVMFPIARDVVFSKGPSRRRISDGDRDRLRNLYQ